MKGQIQGLKVEILSSHILVAEFNQFMSDVRMIVAPTLYKFLSIAAAEAVLSTGTLRWATPSTFNDPFDVQTPLAFNVNDDEVVELAVALVSDRLKNGGPAGNILGQVLDFLKSFNNPVANEDLLNGIGTDFTESMKKLRNRLPSFNEDMISGLSNSKLLCLSERNDTPTMWSHYAENHCGVVAGFYGSPESNSAFKLARPVKYADAAPNFVSKEKLARVLAGYENFDVQETLDKYIYTKSRDWAYECEWRINSAAGREPDSKFEMAPFFRNDLVSITFGLRTSVENRERWKNYAKQIQSRVAFFETRQNGMNLEIINVI